MKKIYLVKAYTLIIYGYALIVCILYITFLQYSCCHHNNSCLINNLINIVFNYYAFVKFI